ncbi:MAG: universal stress protein [Planctomycetota bacterium]|nr:MAG: universal stress protein [Planctomycetota bacterium]
MSSFLQKILAPTDFSETSQKGLEYALKMAKFHEAELILLYVVEPLVTNPLMGHAVQMAAEIEAEMEEQGKIKLEEVSKEWNYDKLRLIVRRGSSYQVILDVAQEENIDLIVIGTHGRSGISHFLLGSTAEKVIRKANCPVLTIRG